VSVAIDNHNNSNSDFDTLNYGDINFDLMKYFGQMNDPSCSSYIKGPCGDFMEFYLIFDKSGRISEINYYTEGCEATKTCASVACRLALNKSVDEALMISAGMITKKIKGLPDDHKHCAILSVTALYRALADYLLMP
jgi:nitrogen fixation NifU-like protein